MSETTDKLQGIRDALKRRVSIPKSSFTAFRLSYATPREIGEHSKVVFLGKVPDAWLEGSRNNSFLIAAGKRTKRSVKKKFKSAASEINKSIAHYALTSNPEHKKRYRDFGFNFFQAGGLEDEDMSMSTDEEAPEIVVSTPDDVQSRALESSESKKSISDLLSPRSNTSTLTKDEMGDERNDSTKLDESLQPDSKPRPKPQQLAASRQTTVEPHDHLHLADAQSDQLTREPDETRGDEKSDKTTLSVLSSDSAASNYHSVDSKRRQSGERRRSRSVSVSSKSTERLDDAHMEQVSPTSSFTSGAANPSQKVHFGSQSNRLTISFANPEPESEETQLKLQSEYIMAEKQHLKSLHRIREFASRTKGSAKNKGSTFKLRMASKVLGAYKAGEIIRTDKMLVKVEYTGEAFSGALTEEQAVETRTLKRWKEFSVVMKRTASADSPLAISLHEPDDISGKARLNLMITPDIRAEFYSLSDKTIAITETRRAGVRIMVFNPKYSCVSLKWLYVIQDIVQNRPENTFNVHIPGLGIEFRVKLPNDVARKALQSEDNMIVEENLLGYSVQHDAGLEFVRANLIKRLEDISKLREPVRQWLDKTSYPWFVFRFYDRLEWATSSSKYFMMENQLYLGAARLELRDIVRKPLSTRDPSGNELQQPYPVEGFLLRLSNTSGKEFSNFRVFFRISYFYTADSMLFFTKFFEATPPLPSNGSSKDTSSGLDGSCPQTIYTKDPFAVDANEHISWLFSDDFETKDAQALKEFERRVLLVAKAEAMIDLCFVKDVRSIPVESILLHHLYFQSLFYYSSPTILTDEALIDLGFEIELLNGSRLRLLAPCRQTRDEWVSRLNQLVTYWRNHRTVALGDMIRTRKDNQSKLHIDEYVDSNFINESKGKGLSNGFANSSLFDTSGLAMPLSVLASGYLYQKYKKHLNFLQVYAVLCPGYLNVFSIFKRSLKTGMWKKLPYFEHSISVPLSDCYVYSGNATELDLISESVGKTPGRNDLPRMYPDGWKSLEENPQRCFTLWFGSKRSLKDKKVLAKNPGQMHVIRKYGITGKSVVFMARSRQEREFWVNRILLEINRFYEN